MRTAWLKVLLLGFFLLLPSAYAKSGACSGHGGVSCSAGPDSDGSVICNDGWRNSSVSYSSMAMCANSSTPSIPTYTPAPTPVPVAPTEPVQVTLSTDKYLSFIEADSRYLDEKLATLKAQVTSKSDLFSRGVEAAESYEDQLLLLQGILITYSEAGVEVQQVFADHLDAIESEKNRLMVSSGIDAKQVAGLQEMFDLTKSLYEEEEKTQLNEYDVIWPELAEKKVEEFKVVPVVESNTTPESTEEIATQVSDFVDSAASPYAAAIRALRASKVVGGYGDGTYKPKNTINRAEFLKIVLEARGIPGFGSGCFPDVHQEWFAGYVCAAKTIGLIEGYYDGTFRPGSSITAAEALKITMEAYALDASTVSTLTDIWFEKYVTYAQLHSLWVPTFQDAQSLVTREEMAELIYRIKK